MSFLFSLYYKTMRIKSLFPRKDGPGSFLLALILGVLLAVGGSVLATSIGTDISVSGALTVNGGSTFGDASGDINKFTGTLQASTTALFTAASTFYGDVTLGDAATDINLFTGTLQASTTALFTTGITTYGSDTLGDAAADALTVNATTTVVNGATFQGDVLFGNASTDLVILNSAVMIRNNVGTTTIPNSSANSLAYATSSTAGPAFVKFDTSNVFVGIATNTPSATLDIGGDGSLAVTAATGTATSTIRLQSRGTTRGGCIEIESVDGASIFRLYATTTVNTNQGGVAYADAVFELGSCR